MERRDGSSCPTNGKLTLSPSLSLSLEMVPSMVADYSMHRMDEFVYQAVVDPKFLSKEVRNVLNKEPIVLPLWDPMGALA